MNCSSKWQPQAEQERLEANLERICGHKKAAYEDFREGLISRRDFLRYQEDYERQEREAAAQLEQLSGNGEDGGRPHWVDDLIRQGKLTALDRVTVAETVKQILVFEDGHIDIAYTFSNSDGFEKLQR